ncbi:TrmH family RNA methyltransferase [Aquirufa sp.]|jgi:tRNA G18 (ribose-2'-O)-methylase SpoU|uniref:TrmH family RNA methyltransferase n=1 Tax=Aquirufa sp. TaxID=2676249 RepID=UPI003783DB21
MSKKLSMDELNRLDISAYKTTEKFPYVIVLDDIRSMNNIGSAFRTGDAFKCAVIHLCGITAQPPHREISKTALGADESVDWLYFEEGAASRQALRAEGYQIVCVEQVQGAVSLEKFEPVKGKKYAFVFGNEVFGVNDEWIQEADFSLEIPQFGTKHSLNVSVSMGVVIWDFVSKIIA